MNTFAQFLFILYINIVCVYVRGISADSRKKGHQGGAIIREHCSIKKGHTISSKMGTLKSCSKHLF